VADFLSEKRAEIDSRLKELRPLYDEYQKLERAKAALDGLDGAAKPARATTGNGRKRRRRAGGTAAEHALVAVRQNPGITVSELAPKLGIKHKNYLYRVMAGLQQDGAVQKQGRGFVAV
jgi:transposase-like protein